MFTKKFKKFSLLTPLLAAKTSKETLLLFFYEHLNMTDHGLSSELTQSDGNNETQLRKERKKND